MTFDPKSTFDPEDGLVLRGPIELAVALFGCWKCKAETEVAALLASDLEIPADEQAFELLESPAFVHSVEEDAMPKKLAVALADKAPSYRPAYSRTLQETTWANTCGHCGALPGAFFLHSEPDGPFSGGPENFLGKKVALLAESVQAGEASYSY